MKLRRYQTIPLLLFAYTTTVAAIYIPQTPEREALHEKLIILGVSYLIIVLLFFVLKKRDKVQNNKKP